MVMGVMGVRRKKRRKQRRRRRRRRVVDLVDHMCCLGVGGRDSVPDRPIPGVDRDLLVPDLVLVLVLVLVLDRGVQCHHFRRDRGRM